MEKCNLFRGHYREQGGAYSGAPFASITVFFPEVIREEVWEAVKNFKPEPETLMQRFGYEENPDAVMQQPAGGDKWTQPTYARKVGTIKEALEFR